jgi:formate dehydrogenase maturation protein FdhE
VRPRDRGGPAGFAERRRRAAQLAATSGVEQPLAVLASVLDHQQDRARDATVVAAAALVGLGGTRRAVTGSFPVLDVTVATDAVDTGVVVALRALAGDGLALPDPLFAAARLLGAPSLRAEVTARWLTDPPAVDPRLGFWISVAAAPILELAAAEVRPPGPQQWTAGHCPVCGGAPQLAVIAEESGEFMAGSPRSLICSRCASRWGYPRATCVACGEDDSRRVGGWTAETWPAIRIEACDTCRAYIKTFDLRQPGGRDIVPLVDDVASAALDLWAADQGLRRPVRSLAGV